MNVGDIVCMELILFNNGVDHNSKSGRPCVYIGEKNDVMYFIPLSSVKNKNKHMSYHIMPDGLNKLRKPSLLNLHTIIEKRPQFFKVDGYIKDSEMKILMKTIISYFKDASREQTKIVKEIAAEFLDASKTDIKYSDDDIKKKQDKIK